MELEQQLLSDKKRILSIVEYFVVDTMKVHAAALVLTLAASAAAFAPSRPSSSAVAIISSPRRTSFRLGSTLDRPAGPSSPPPERVAPDAARVPDWEGRRNPPSGSTAEFMNSDPDEPEIGDRMWECPLTRWDAGGIDVRAAQGEARRAMSSSSSCPLEVRASGADNDLGAAYFEKNGEKLRRELVEHGAIWFRGFELMSTVAGNRRMHEAMGLEPCLDPLHSSGLRKFASERDALYEEVSVCLRERERERENRCVRPWWWVVF